MSLAQAIIDALADDLNANAGLPAHGTVRYRRPTAITPKMCPLLVVWLARKVPTPKSTVEFHSVYQIGISWHEQTVREAQTLRKGDAKALSLLQAQEAIEARLRALSPAGLGVDEAWETLPGESTYLSPGAPDTQTGLVEGYAVEAIVKVVEAA